jgi:alkaline phosphatase
LFNWSVNLRIFNADQGFWYAQGKEDLLRALNRQLNLNTAKNVIFFLGDGMGVSTVTAARIHAGQKLGQPGEEHYLSFEKFPNLGLLKVK